MCRGKYLPRYIFFIFAHIRQSTPAADARRCLPRRADGRLPLLVPRQDRSPTSHATSYAALPRCAPFPCLRDAAISTRFSNLPFSVAHAYQGNAAHSPDKAR